MQILKRLYVELILLDIFILFYFIIRLIYAANVTRTSEFEGKWENVLKFSNVPGEVDPECKSINQ